MLVRGEEFVREMRGVEDMYRAAQPRAHPRGVGEAAAPLDRARQPRAAHLRAAVAPRSAFSRVIVTLALPAARDADGGCDTIGMTDAAGGRHPHLLHERHPMSRRTRSILAGLGLAVLLTGALAACATPSAGPVDAGADREHRRRHGRGRGRGRVARRRTADRARHDGQLDLRADRRGADARRLGARGRARRARRRHGLHPRSGPARRRSWPCPRASTPRRISRSRSPATATAATPTSTGVAGLGGPRRRDRLRAERRLDRRRRHVRAAHVGIVDVPAGRRVRRRPPAPAEVTVTFAAAPRRSGVHDGHGAAGHGRRGRRVRGRARTSKRCWSTAGSELRDGADLRRELTPIP